MKFAFCALGPILEELPYEQEFDNKIGVIDLETYTINIDKILDFVMT